MNQFSHCTTFIELEAAYNEAMAPHDKAYEEAMAAHYKPYKATINLHFKAYEEAAASCYEAYKTGSITKEACNDDIAQLDKDYNNAVAPHIKAHKDAVAPHIKAHNDAVAPLWDDYQAHQKSLEHATGQTRWNQFINCSTIDSLFDKFPTAWHLAENDFVLKVEAKNDFHKQFEIIKARNAGKNVPDSCGHLERDDVNMFINDVRVL